MNDTNLTIDSRFCGPPTSANGGYCSGVLAGLLPDAATGACCRLAAPPPLDTPLRPVFDGDKVRLLDGDQEVGSAWPEPLDLDPPPPPDWPHAVAAVEGYTGFRSHPFPHCFVCGPERAPADGLRVFAGSIGEGQLAAPWLPDASLGDETGSVRPEYLWAALDCPGAFTYADFGDQTIVLGQLHGRIDGQLHVDDAVVVIAWPIATEGRKHIAGTALYRAGELIACAKATWITLRA